MLRNNVSFLAEQIFFLAQRFKLHAQQMKASFANHFTLCFFFCKKE
jgi:hypothetical protein